MILVYILSFIFILSTIVFVHEFGHYIVAKACGVKVEAFSIGFGKELVGWNDRSGTRWKISLLPLGGYVRMFGDSSEASTPDDKINQMTDAEKAVSFHHKPLYKKAMVVVAGPVFNFILTIVILTWFILSNGLQSTPPVIGEILKDTPAMTAGLKAGDRVLRVDGQTVERFSDIPQMLATNLYKPVELIIQRGGKQFTKTITPIQKEDEDVFGNKIKRPLIGIRSGKPTLEKNVGFFRAVQEASKSTLNMCTSTLKAVGQMISGQRSAEDLKGPIGIAKLSGQAADKGMEEGSFEIIFWFIAMLSANLGLVNLFPIPLLDGGHLLYYAVEAVRGKPMAVRIQQYGFRVGGAMLIMLMGFSLFNDIRHLFL